MKNNILKKLNKITLRLKSSNTLSMYDSDGLFSALSSFGDCDFNDGIEIIYDDITFTKRKIKEGIDWPNFYEILKKDLEDVLKLDNEKLKEVAEYIYNFCTGGGYMTYGCASQVIDLYRYKGLDTSWVRPHLEMIYKTIYQDDPDFKKDLIKYIKV